MDIEWINAEKNTPSESGEFFTRNRFGMEKPCHFDAGSKEWTYDGIPVRITEWSKASPL